MFNRFINIFSFGLLVLFVNSIGAQPLFTTPRTSQAAQISQTIGVTEIKINYHRPGVKGRTIWGDLVPYNKVWRAGANENTTISFSDPVKIQGNSLEAGEYGLHMIPTENDWTIIFSNVSWAWGSFSYDSTEDALRIKVKPESSVFEEYLNYRFDNPTKNSVDVALYWEKVRVPFTVNVNVHQEVVENMRKELRGLNRFFWESWQQAANYCYQNDVYPQQAMEWIDRSIAMNRNFSNLQVKAGLLRKKGNTEEAETLMNEALSMATEAEMNQYGYQLLFGGKIDKAIEIFKKNIEDHPESWNVYDSLGEAYAKKGETDLAIQYYTKALNMVEIENQKDRIRSILKKLKN